MIWGGIIIIFLVLIAWFCIRHKNSFISFVDKQEKAKHEIEMCESQMEIYTVLIKQFQDQSDLKCNIEVWEQQVTDLKSKIADIKSLKRV